MRLTLIAALAVALSAAPAYSQFNTPTVDGNIASNEYGVHVDGQNLKTGNSAGWYMTWDDTYLYVAVTHKISDGTILYIDANPIVPSQGGTNADGSLIGLTYDKTQLTMRTRADFFCYFKQGEHEFRLANGAGGWGGSEKNTLGYAVNVAAESQEIRIPWSAINKGNGRPASFNWCGNVVYKNTPSGQGSYGQVPSENIGGAVENPGVQVIYYDYIYTVTNTNDGTSSKPFASSTLPVGLSAFNLE